ncbi:hypothetical protein EBI_27236 [Enterocytozoon bieneusi H348]|nr:hypothetical protein EBI_27236 [Enterocytozoon bieneusi H348]|eukprot:XP_002650609.1 hypothetical protein EBI_27236 [Enterocytozoon bieneusi H348]
MNFNKVQQHTTTKKLSLFNFIIILLITIFSLFIVRYIFFFTLTGHNIDHNKKGLYYFFLPQIEVKDELIIESEETPTIPIKIEIDIDWDKLKDQPIKKPSPVEYEFKTFTNTKPGNIFIQTFCDAFLSDLKEWREYDENFYNMCTYNFMTLYNSNSNINNCKCCAYTELINCLCNDISFDLLNGAANCKKFIELYIKNGWGVKCFPVFDKETFYSHSILPVHILCAKAILQTSINEMSQDCKAKRGNAIVKFIFLLIFSYFKGIDNYFEILMSILLRAIYSFIQIQGYDVQDINFLNSPFITELSNTIFEELDNLFKILVNNDFKEDIENIINQPLDINILKQSWEGAKLMIFMYCQLLNNNTQFIGNITYGDFIKYKKCVLISKLTTEFDLYKQENSISPSALSKVIIYIVENIMTYDKLVQLFRVRPITPEKLKIIDFTYIYK